MILITNKHKISSNGVKWYKEEEKKIEMNEQKCDSNNRVKKSYTNEYISIYIFIYT